ncbi:hypothetical protein JTE90_024534 [Oedothorax gibbosus]|uniref:Ephrin RBD domain-containing protein n=1 Tax=Oedothorax gibbosus TaxID=931172 RepID=A0AAV6VC23_9ARAC|nr:hypothetical protein JTE90_024534 [Oedothorax gibbosus]
MPDSGYSSKKSAGYLYFARRGAEVHLHVNFRIDNTDHIIDVNKNNLPFEYDQVNIICPVYPHSNPGTSTEEENEEEEQYIIYNVSKEEYDSCRITNPNPRIIAVCDKPNQLMYFTITFRSFTPQPGGLEFVPGHDYYFVSTSTGDPEGLHQRMGGRCATHNMKVIFKVCCNPSSKPGIEDGSVHKTSPSNSSAPATPSSTIIHNTSSRPLNEVKSPFDRNYIHPPSVPASQATPSPKGMRPVTRIPPPPYHMRPYEVPIEDEMDRSPPADKNKEEVSKPPKRERAKNEELAGNAGPPTHRWSNGAYYCIVACLLYRLLQSLLFR